MTNSTPPVSTSIADIKALIHRESRRVTSYDVASAAGVSQSAVSRCFKPGASVSKATYARVMQAAADLDYTPNAAARSLNTRRSNLIALVVSSQVSLHYPELLDELSGHFALRGMRLLLFPLSGKDGSGGVAALLADLWQHQVDGAVIAAPLEEQDIAEFERRQMPVVLFNRSVRDRQINAIVCDQAGAARIMVARLAAAGHRSFAMIDGPAGSSVALARRRGVTERLAELGLAAPLTVSGEHDYASGARGLREIIDRLGAAPDAIICSNDSSAIGCLDAARIEFGLDVPGRLSITGFDGIAPASWLSHQLTTLRLPVRQMAQATADMLVGLIASGASGVERRVFSASLVDGATARLGAAA
ncbi:LacI family DNA-binding transcriptional regulator [Massilia sp. DWR3-1-1]|uniref:LacI family DNA-binding transcriptional regulator n=1 Tax=Massilia sp. DWR3-1-1 TaxID=2804559 RepID=UPI003CF6D361